MSKQNINLQPPSTTTASEVREHLADFLNVVRFGNKNIVIEKSGSPYAVLISIDSWDEYKKYLREKAQ
jgi:prevent-host-death family protein